jgi:hypothetical protein
MIPIPYLGSICHKAFALALSPHRAFEMKSNQYLEKFVIVFILSQLSIRDDEKSAYPRCNGHERAVGEDTLRQARAWVCGNWQDTPVALR